MDRCLLHTQRAVVGGGLCLIHRAEAVHIQRSGMAMHQMALVLRNDALLGKCRCTAGQKRTIHKAVRMVCNHARNHNLASAVDHLPASLIAIAQTVCHGGNAIAINQNITMPEFGLSITVDYGGIL